jgi:hypothetical protein
MSTYDGAYSNRNADYGARVCCCGEEVNDFCRYHGKYGDGSFKQSEEHRQLKIKLGVSQYEDNTQ